MASLRPGAVDRGRLPVQQRDRRAALSALALLLVVAGALGSALVVYRSGHRTDVLVAAHDLKPGQVITADDLSTARVANDSGDTVPATSRAHFIGSFATVGVPAGTLLNRFMFLTGSVLPPDGVVVGIVLSNTHRPEAPVKMGDVVRIYFVPKDVGATTVGAGGLTPAVPAPATAVPSGATVLVSAAAVYEAPTSLSGDSETISVLLKPADAQAVVLDAADQEVAVARLPIGTVPYVQLQTVGPTTGTATPAPATATATATASPTGTAAASALR